MATTCRQLLFTAVAVSLLMMLAPERAPVSASALVIQPSVMPLGLPDAKTARAVLSASLLHHHPQWVDVPMGTSTIRAFVIYPDLSGQIGRAHV